MVARTMEDLLRIYDQRIKILERRLQSAGGTGGVIESPTAPSFPAPGQLWLDTTTGTLYVYYTDSDGSQWIETGVGGGSIPGRNKIINGTFRTNQRAYASAGSLASGAFGHDRWKANAATTSYTFTAAPRGQIITIASGKGLSQVIEQDNVEAGDYVLSWEGTATGRVYNSGAGAPAYAASPVQVTLDGTADVVVEFTATGATQTLYRVQFESGNSPTVFEFLSVGEELAACQRYYYRISGNFAHHLGFAKGKDTTSAFCYIPFKQTMRDIPATIESASLELENPGVGTIGVTAAYGLFYIGTDGGTIILTGTGISTGVMYFLRFVSAGHLAFNAEL